MANSLLSQQCHAPKTNKEEDERVEKLNQELEELLQTLPREKGWITPDLFKFQGFWLSKSSLKGFLLLKSNFKPQSTDIFLASFPKCGTTWLGALIYATMNRSRFNFSNHPLLTTGPHDCIHFIDFYDYPIPTFEDLPSPRLFNTHFPYTILPESLKTSGSKFVYITRDPKDELISSWHFFNKIKLEGLPVVSIEEAFERFCKGSTDYGVFWDHVLGYWKASLDFPDQVLFLRYEDMRRDPSNQLKKLAEFIGYPFSSDEERDGVVQEILNLCSFESLSNLEVNKKGNKEFSVEFNIPNRQFFRKGQIGDSKNYLTDQMIECLDQITAQKFEGFGLTIGW